MKIIDQPIQDLILFEPEIIEDARGSFIIGFNNEFFSNLFNRKIQIVQENVSYSMEGVLRGLHFQNKPHAQDKLISIDKGSVLDVCVDIRNNSPTFGQHATFRLSENDNFFLWVPKGFAHGFVSLEDNTQIVYRITEHFNKEAENCIRWNDPVLNVEWPSNFEFVISERDQNSEFFDIKKQYL
tara:strand:- start:469 stop:1017 length:549 start_codon:yes stop_codon:yes gene_type:complete